MPAQELWQRLRQTEAYRRVDGLDEAQDEPVWDAAGTLEVTLDGDLRPFIDTLRQQAGQAGAAAAHRARG